MKSILFLCFGGSLLLASSATVTQAQMGHVLNAIGPVNQSMGGAGVAMPLEAMGALHWNPASIMGLESSEISFSFQAFAPETNLSSSVESGAFGAGTPPGAISGSTSSDTDISPIPSFAFVCRPKDSRWAFGLSGFGIGGFGVDYPGDATNPITTPQAPNGFGFGPIFSQFQILQITTTAAYQLNDLISIGFGLNTDWASLAVSPFSAATPDDANGDGFFTYPPGSRTDAVWGLGFQTGIYYENPLTGVHLGASYKSPQWMQTYSFNSQDELGAGRTLKFDLDYPMILSFGAGYSGWDRWRHAIDVRYIDYRRTDGFWPGNYDSTGAVTGFGWNSIWAVSAGTEYRINSALALRAGYAFNESPITSDTAFYNVSAPGIIQHHISTGFTYQTRQEWAISLAVSHGFRNSVSGPWLGTSGPIAGTSVTSRLATYSVSGGLSKRF